MSEGKFQGDFFLSESSSVYRKDEGNKTQPSGK